MSEVRIVNQAWGSHVLVFDSEDIETFSMPRDTQLISERNGFREHVFTGTSHLNLTFKQDRHPRWESA